MGQADGMINSYLKEGLVALLPDYREGCGGTQVLTLAGAHRERRNLFWLVEVLARHFQLDLGAVRRQTGKLLELSHHIPLPLAEGLVLLPVKVRRTEELGEPTAGYVNLLYVERVEEAGGKSRDLTCFAADDPALTRSLIICRGGVAICSLNVPATVKTKLNQGETARQALLQRQQAGALPAAPFRGLDGGALQEMLPPCDCFLRSAFLLLLERTAGQGDVSPVRRQNAQVTTESINGRTGETSPCPAPRSEQ